MNQAVDADGARQIVKFAIVGAGNRGSGYARIAARSGRAEIRAIAEPRIVRRDALAAECGVDAEALHTDWRTLLAARPDVDVVVVATQDVDHEAPAMAFLEAGYDILLEKPMAPSREAARRIAEASAKANRRVVVAHVLRYQPYTRKLVELIKSGAIGDVVQLDHLEPIGHLHFAHAYVRGNWRNEATASSALMSKSCHDIDWIAAIMGRRAERVASFGSLHHFRPEHAPEGSAARCLSCAVEATCAFSALRQYLAAVHDKAGGGWPATIIADELTEEAVLSALETGPYGRCVYRSDNDVVDHQVVAIEFEGGRTANFTMSGLARQGHRRSRIGGTKGYIEGDGERITLFDYLTQETTVIEIDGMSGVHSWKGHGGGDEGLITSLIDAVATGDWSNIPTGAAESLATHEIVWAAEDARKQGRIVKIR